MAIALAAAAVAGSAQWAVADFVNRWPFFVSESGSPSGRPDSFAAAGPLWGVTQRGDSRIVSLRPLWLRMEDASQASGSSHWLYPFYNHYWREGFRNGHLLNLVRYRQAVEPYAFSFEVFPVLFWEQGPGAAPHSRALWPFGGTIRQRLWRDEIQFIAWPLYVRTRVGDETRLHLPYPFIRYHSGPLSSGFGIWPLFGQFEREGDYRRQWALWPIYYRLQERLSEPVPYTRWGIWPLYHHESAAGLRSHGWIWPLFGYSREQAPRANYAENRYLYPFWITGRGDERRVDRWLPLYASEHQPGYAKQWYLWPLLKREQIDAGAVQRDRTTVGWFIYRDERQRARQGDWQARLASLWPLYGYWNDGHGRRQWQLLDPFSLFFANNSRVRENWSPLFAIYRYDERPGNRRHSLLWNFISYERDASVGWRFTLGPLLDLHGGGASGGRKSANQGGR